MTELTCFKAYDVRGQLGAELNVEIAYAIGVAFAQHLGAKRVVVGGDIRQTSDELKEAVARGLMAAGCDVVDLGMVGTEEIYFAAAHLDVDGGIEVTASHNPMDYNGMKFVARGAVPISGDEGLGAIKRLAEKYLAAPGDFAPSAKPGSLSTQSLLDDYADNLLTFIKSENLKPLKLVVNSGNGASGHVIDALETRFNAAGVPVEFVKVHHQPDGTFPNGIPNPLLRENRASTSQAVIDSGADFGVAWDGDFDRCFLFDEHGAFIEGYYIVGLLAEAFLRQNPGEKIIHDPRLTWNTIDIVNNVGGTAIQSQTGHSFIKQNMRSHNAIYGGEMSAHHYFRDFAYCDSGMIPWLLIAELVSTTGTPLSQLVGDRIKAFPCSGEINYRVTDTKQAIESVRKLYDNGATPCTIDTDDGVSISFETWRLNLRSSNTEPLLRLNVEARGDAALVAAKVAEIEALIS